MRERGLSLEAYGEEGGEKNHCAGASPYDEGKMILVVAVGG